MDAGFRKQILGLDLATFATAFAKSFHGDKTLLTEDEMRTVLANAHEEYRKKQASLREEKAQATLKEGEKFLAENKNKEGVLTFHRRHIDVHAALRLRRGAVLLSPPAGPPKQSDWSS